MDSFKLYCFNYSASPWTFSFQLFLKHFIVRQTFSQIRGSERCEDLLFAALKQNTNSLSMFQSRADTTATFPFSDPRQVQHSVSHTHSVLSPTLWKTLNRPSLSLRAGRKKGRRKKRAEWMEEQKQRTIKSKMDFYSSFVEQNFQRRKCSCAKNIEVETV